MSKKNTRMARSFCGFWVTRPFSVCVPGSGASLLAPEGWSQMKPGTKLLIGIHLVPLGS